MGDERSDEELIAAIAAGELAALESLYARFAAAAFALALRLLGNRETAEEVVQEAFLNVWRHAAGFQPQRGRARSWLFGITHHRAVDRLRSRRARGDTVPIDDEMQLAGRSDVWADVSQLLDRAAIRAALQALPEEQRLSIELAYFEGLTYPEIARRLDVPLGTIKSRLRLGLEKLRVLLAEPILPRQEAGPSGD